MYFVLFCFIISRLNLLQYKVYAKTCLCSKPFETWVVSSLYKYCLLFSVKCSLALVIRNPICLAKRWQKICVSSCCHCRIYVSFQASVHICHIPTLCHFSPLCSNRWWGILTYILTFIRCDTTFVYFNVNINENE